MLLISYQGVEQLVSMKDCLEVLETAYRDLANWDAGFRPRIDMWATCNDSIGEIFRWASMEGLSRTLGIFAIGMKSDIVYWGERKTAEKFCMEPGTHCGFVMLFSIHNGEPLAIIPDGVIQHIRM